LGSVVVVEFSAQLFLKSNVTLSWAVRIRVRLSLNITMTFFSMSHEHFHMGRFHQLCTCILVWKACMALMNKEAKFSKKDQSNTVYYHYYLTF
jgi:hypothetical protein